MEFLDRSDFDYLHTTPSNHESPNFQKMHSLIKGILQSQISIFYFGKDNAEIEKFIKTNFILGNANLTQIQITSDNFVHIYIKWLNAVKPSIDIDWNEAKKQGILDTDFYLADMLSVENKTLKDKLYIILDGSRYALLRGKNKIGLFEKSEVLFNDSQVAHKQFWNRYERPPATKFWNEFINRRDLLVPEDIRERKGAFYTPQIWVQKAQEYLAQSLGENWQEQYYIWDCAAGTGNLLAGLKNARNIYASTLDKADVNIMKDLVRTNEESIKLNLLENHIFEFDFLNDSFFDKVDDKSGKITESKLPKSLQEIIKNEPHKLVIFINPPYSTSGNARTQRGTGQNKALVSKDTTIYHRYKKYLSALSDEIYTQFFIRIYEEIPNSILASFSTPKYINSYSSSKFRQEFKAKFLKGFIVPSTTFDNTNSKIGFPIGFWVWNLEDKQEIKKCRVSIFSENNKHIGKKIFYAEKKYITEWLQKFYDDNNEKLGILRADAPDFQNNNQIAIISKKGKGHKIYKPITKYNLIPFCVYFAVRQVISPSWLNNKDNFLYPNKKWRDDEVFQNDCLAYAIFDEGQNKITTNEDINHFIPFSESQVGAKEAFTSDFMVRFINGKLGKDDTTSSFSSLRASKASAASACEGQTQSKIHKSDSRNEQTLPFDKKEIQADIQSFVPTKPLEFSKEAQEVFSAGLALWRYYHSQAKSSDKYLNDASLYDIKEYFQGRVPSSNGKKGKMNARSEDTHYNDLIAQLRITLQTLADKLTPKIYEYGFLLE